MQKLQEPPPLPSAKAIEARQQMLNDQQLMAELLPPSVGDLLRSTIKKQRRELGERVAHEEKQLAEILDKLAAVQNTNDVQRLALLLSRAQNFFQQTARAATVAEALERAETFKVYFKTLNQFDVGSITTPADVSAKKQGISDVFTRYQANLYDTQRDVMQKQLEHVEKVLRLKQDEARTWFNKRQEKLVGAATAGELNQLERELQSPPAFLPDELQQERIEMHRQIAAKLDGLELEAIEDRFKQLDSAKRVKCLQRLQAVMRELEAV